MTRHYRIFWAALALMLTLTACAKQPESQEPSVPTLPSFPQSLTPEQQLSAALDKTMAQGCYEIRYGTRTVVQGETVEQVHAQSVSQSDGLNWEQLYEYAPGLPDRKDFISTFSNMPLGAIPSNTGILRYELTELDAEAAGQLLYADGRIAHPADGLWTVALTVDAAGRLSGLEIVGEGQNETMIIFVELNFPEGA